MEFLGLAVLLVVVATAAQAITLSRIRKNENIRIPFTFTKGVRSYWDFYLEPDKKKKYLWQYAGWVLLFLAIGVVLYLAIGVVVVVLMMPKP